MHAANRNRRCPAKLLATALCLVLGSGAVRAATTWFFDASQTTNLVAVNATTDIISSEGYLFTYGSEFSYDTSPNHLGTTVALTDYDAYVISLTLDYALTSLTVVDASLAPPALAISQVDVGLIEMSWPATAVDYTLEFATNLSAPVWDPVTNRVTIHGDRFTAQLATGDIQQLYRLRYP